MCLGGVQEKLGVSCGFAGRREREREGLESCVERHAFHIQQEQKCIQTNISVKSSSKTKMLLEVEPRQQLSLRQPPPPQLLRFPQPRCQTLLWALQQLWALRQDRPVFHGRVRRRDWARNKSLNRVRERARERARERESENICIHRLWHLGEHSKNSVLMTA